MKSVRETVLSTLDHSVRWTGMPARIADGMSGAPSVDRKHRPMRWVPIFPIALSCALFILAVAWPPVLDRLSPGAVIAIMGGLVAAIGGMVPSIHMSGPLGKPSLEDDEREQTLRKDSYLLCLALLAVLNCLGQPILFILSHLQNWHIEQIASVTLAALMLNGTLFGSLPTLYASWKWGQLPKE